MQLVNNLMMFSMAVSDMPAAKAFYADKLGLEIKKEYRQDDNNWWVTLILPEGSTSITLTTNHENMKPGSMKLYMTTSDITSTHNELLENEVKIGEIKDNLFGPGSGVKWFDVTDPDGNQVLIAQV